MYNYEKIRCLFRRSTRRTKATNFTSSKMTINYTGKNLALKGWIGGFGAVMAIASYIAYYFCYYEGINYDAFYFIATGLSISIFTGLLFTFFENKVVRTFLLFASVFYGILVLSYSAHWAFTELPYAYIKISLMSGLIVGIIYFIYDLFSSSSNAKN